MIEFRKAQDKENTYTESLKNKDTKESLKGPGKHTVPNQWQLASEFSSGSEMSILLIVLYRTGWNLLLLILLRHPNSSTYRCISSLGRDGASENKPAKKTKK